jgi:hypothetical protein
MAPAERLRTTGDQEGGTVERIDQDGCGKGRISSSEMGWVREEPFAFAASQYLNSKMELPCNDHIL